MMANISITGRKIIQNVAIYSASAWAFIEAASFLIDRYSFADERLLDAAMFAALLGACIVSVITWFHGTPGRQPFPPIEKVLLASLAIVALAGATVIATADPYAEFLAADGFRITVAFRNDPGDEDGDGEYGYKINVPKEEHKNMLAMAEKAHIFSMNPDSFILTLPGVVFSGKGMPVSIRHSRDLEYATVTLILPSQPEDILPLQGAGSTHESAYIEYSGNSLRIDRPFELEITDEGAEFKIIGPLALDNLISED